MITVGSRRPRALPGGTVGFVALVLLVVGADVMDLGTVTGDRVLDGRFHGPRPRARVRTSRLYGKPCYGYKAKTFRHPNPAKAAKGQVKTRLEPGGVRAETVTQIALWRYHEGLGYDTIADRLNADPTKYPPPEPPGKTRARGAWGKTSVYEILRNPKYTGFQVFNRRASRSRHGKVNDR